MYSSCNINNIFKITYKLKTEKCAWCFLWHISISKIVCSLLDWNVWKIIFSPWYHLSSFKNSFFRLGRNVHSACNPIYTYLRTSYWSHGAHFSLGMHRISSEDCILILYSSVMPQSSKYRPALTDHLSCVTSSHLLWKSHFQCFWNDYHSIIVSKWMLSVNYNNLTW